MVFELLAQKLLTVHRSFSSMDKGRQILIIPFALIGIGFGWFLYFISSKVLQFLLQQGDAGQTLIIHGLATVMAGLFFLLIISTTITALTTIFKTRENVWLFSQPVSALSIFIYKSIETAVYSAWIMLILALPIMLALQNTFAASAVAMLFLILGVVLLFSLACCIGILLALLLTRLLPYFQKFSWLLILAIAAWVAWKLIPNRQTQESSLLPDINSFAAIRQYLSGLQTSSPFMPSSWLTLSFWEAARHNIGSALYWLSMLAATLFFGIEILLVLAASFYQSLWWSDQSQTNRKNRSGFKLPRLIEFSSPLAALLIKDLKTFVRDTRQWLQTITLGSLFVFLIIILRQIPTRYKVAEALFAGMIAYLAFAIAGYFLTTLALRFVYPAMSLEGRSFWQLLVSPMQRKKLLQIKLYPLLFGLTLIACSLMLLIANLLNQPAIIAIYELLALIATGSVIVMLTFSVGSIWLNQRETDPSKLASSLPAIITTLIIFGYLTIVVMILAVPFDSYFKAILADGFFDRGFADRLIALIVGSSLAIDLILWHTTRTIFERRDF